MIDKTANAKQPGLLKATLASEVAAMSDATASAISESESKPTPPHVLLKPQSIHKVHSKSRASVGVHNNSQAGVVNSAVDFASTSVSILPSAKQASESLASLRSPSRSEHSVERVEDYQKKAIPILLKNTVQNG